MGEYVKLADAALVSGLEDTDNVLVESGGCIRRATLSDLLDAENTDSLKHVLVAVADLVANSGLGAAYVHLVGGDTDTTVTINGADVTIKAGETWDGYVDTISLTSGYDLREVVSVGNIRVMTQYSVERYEAYFGSDYRTTLAYQLSGNDAVQRVVLAGGLVTGFTAAFNGCSALECADVSALGVGPECTAVGNLFYQCRALGSASNGMLDLSGWDVSGVVTWGYCFTSCEAITTLKLGLWDVGAADSTLANVFQNMRNLAHIDGKITNIRQNISFSASTDLDRESMVMVLEGLHDFASEGASGGTVTFNATARARLTDDDIAIATAKGWTVA